MNSLEVFRSLEERELLDLIGPQTIYVFGSDLTGRHNIGDALVALKYWGARTGTAVGLCGHSYAILIRNTDQVSSPLDHVRLFIELFVRFAIDWPAFTFGVAKADVLDSVIATAKWRLFFI